MNRDFFYGFLLSAVLLYGNTAAAASSGPAIDESWIPIESARPADFVPAGWSIEESLQQDLNGDGKTDAVLELIETLPHGTEEETPPERTRALAVLLQTPVGGYRRIALAGRLLRCTACFGALAGPEGGGAEIKVVKGVIVVEETWGSRETVTTRLRFRYDAASGRIVLIGEDIETFDRATGAGRRESRNCLTGVQLTETLRYDPKRDRLVAVSAKKRRIPKVKRFIDEIDYRSYER
ncbi:hypothetical protein [Methylosarcina fibrata]|uniref:hypothetical protein n=1 Tax=Methylosarcina fibrata TaxID=105972 RepID=UPI0003816210|nr:hypothetical protein [Methylosarcina fibrata]